MEHIVKFDQYCPTCKFEKKDGCEEPCNTCLENFVNEDSRKPTEWRSK